MPKTIEVMNAHDEQRQSPAPAGPWLPVGNGSHFDRGQDRLAEDVVIEQLLERMNRLIETHVLGYRQNNAGITAKGDDLPRLFQIHSERLLRQNAARFRATRNDSLHDLDLVLRRNRNVEYGDRGVGDE